MAEERDTTRSGGPGGKEPEKKSGPLVLELLRPFAVMAAFLLGIEIFMMISGLELKDATLSLAGPSANFRQKERTDIAQSLQDEKDRTDRALADLGARLATLEKSSNHAGAATNGSGTGEIPVLTADVGSDAIASLYRPLPGATSELAQRSGYIFIGNRGSEHDDQALSYLTDGNGQKIPFGRIVNGQLYRITNNLVLRGGQPTNDAAYFSMQPSLGVLSKGSQVTTESDVINYQRGSIVQTWVKVHVSA